VHQSSLVINKIILHQGTEPSPSIFYANTWVQWIGIEVGLIKNNLFNPGQARKFYGLANPWGYRLVSPKKGSPQRRHHFLHLPRGQCEISPEVRPKRYDFFSNTLISSNYTIRKTGSAPSPILCIKFSSRSSSSPVTSPVYGRWRHSANQSWIRERKELTI
jgi:hypothetical protein